MINKIKKAYEKLPRGFKASTAYFFASMITSGIAYITTPIFTRILSPDVYGQTLLYYTWSQLFGVVAMFSLSSGVFNNGMVDYPEKRDEYSFSMLILSNVITIIFTVLLLLLYKYIYTTVKVEFPLIILMCVSFLFQPAFRFWVGKERYEMKYKGVLVFSVIQALIAPTFSIFCLFVLKESNKLYTRIFSWEIILIVFYLCFYLFIANKSHFRLNREYWKQALLFNLPLIPHYLSTYLLGSSDKIMISYFVGDSATAYYGVAHSIASFASIIWTAINATLVPYTYEKCKNKDYCSVNKVSLPILTMFALVCVAIIMFGPEVVNIMAPKDYLEAVNVIPPIICGVFFQVQYYMYSNIIYYYKKPVYVMLGSLIAVFTNIILNYIFIQRYGYIAAGYTTVVSYLIQVIFDYCAMKRVVDNQVYDMKYIISLSLCVIAFTILCTFFYSYTAARYSILLIIFLTCIFFRKRILIILKQLI